MAITPLVIPGASSGNNTSVQPISFDQARQGLGTINTIGIQQLQQQQNQNQPMSPMNPTGSAVNPTGGGMFSNLMNNIKSLPGQIGSAAMTIANKITAPGSGTNTAVQGISDDLANIENVLNPTTSLDQKIEESKNLPQSNPLQAMEGGAEIAAVVLGGPEAGTAASSLAPKVGEAVATGAKNLAIGKEGLETLKQIGDTEAQKFASGKTLGDTVDNVQKAITKFTTDSKKSLQVVKSKIPKIQISPSEIGTRVNQAIMDSVKSNAAYKGVTGDVESMFKTPEDLINSGLLNDDEVKKVNGMVKVISKWKDTSARGVLNLKEQLSPFYKGGLDNSNRILSGIQSNLKDLVGEAYPEIKPALKTASENIEKADEFTRNLIGKDEISGELKLKSIAAGLKNPALNSEKIKLLADLKSATGYDAVPELKGYQNYLQLLGKNFPTKLGTIAKNVATRTGIAGGLTAGGLELKNLVEGL